MSDQDRTTEVQPPAPDPGPKRLLRSRNDRVIAGVAGGLGEYFAIDPIIVRIAFAISVLIGGLGVLAYVALALFVPTAAVGRRRGRGRLRSSAPARWRSAPG